MLCKLISSLHAHYELAEWTFSIPAVRQYKMFSLSFCNADISYLNVCFIILLYLGDYETDKLSRVTTIHPLL